MSRLRTSCLWMAAVGLALCAPGSSAAAPAESGEAAGGGGASVAKPRARLSPEAVRVEAAGGGGASVAKPRARLSPEAVLVEAANEYSYGRYPRVVRLLRPLVERGLFGEHEDRVEALRLFGICLFLTDRRAAAQEVFRTLLRLSPEVRLDPRLVQPEVVAAFEVLRREQARDMRERARRELSRRYGIAVALPPWGQFQNGHWTKGALVLGLELAFLGANIGSYYALRSERLRQPDRTFVEKDAQGNVVKDHRGLAKALMAVNVTSFALLLATVVYGIVDGAVYHVRHRRRLKRLLGEGVSLLGAPAPGGGSVCLVLRF